MASGNLAEEGCSHLTERVEFGATTVGLPEIERRLLSNRRRFSSVQILYNVGFGLELVVFSPLNGGDLEFFGQNRRA